MLDNISNSKNTGWVKSLIIFSSILSLLFLIIFFIAGVPLIILPFLFVILAIIIFILSYFNFVIEGKLGRAITFVYNKFIFENQLGIGETEKSGQIINSWSLPEGRTALISVLHYRKFVLMGYFMLLFLLLTTLMYSVYHDLSSILISFIFSFIGVFLYVFLLWVSSKNWMRLIVYEILSEGIYIRYMVLNELLTGLFVSYSKLENPKFDDKNKIIILKFKNKRFLRRFVVCTQENYKQVSEYIRSKVK